MTLTTMLESSRASSNAWGPELRMFAMPPNWLENGTTWSKSSKQMVTQHRCWTRPSGTAHMPPLFHLNSRADHHPQVPPPTVCERCQRKDREEVQAPCHQNNLQIEGNTQGSLDANKRPPTRVEEERSHVPGTMRWMRECLHRRNRKNTGEEDKWTQRSSKETRCEERHHSTRMDQTAQGGLGSINSQACGDQPRSRRKTIEALHIHLQWETSNLDCGRTLSPVWHPLLWTLTPPLATSTFTDVMHHSLSYLPLKLISTLYFIIYFILFILFLILILGHTSSTVTVTYFSNDFSLVMSVLHQLIKIYGSKCPGYRLLMNSSGCAIAQ